MSPATRQRHLFATVKSFRDPVVYAASRSHEGAQLFQKLYRESMENIDSELRARGLNSLSSEAGIAGLPHVASDSRRRNNKRKKARYEGKTKRSVSNVAASVNLNVFAHNGSVSSCVDAALSSSADEEEDSLPRSTVHRHLNTSTVRLTKDSKQGTISCFVRV